MTDEEELELLASEYLDPTSRIYKKMSIVGQYIHNWDEEITQL